MSWIIAVIIAVILLWLHHLYQKRIDREEMDDTNRVSSISNPKSLWDSLRIRFRKYLDFTEAELSADKMIISNPKGESFTFHKVLTDIIVTYKLNGVEKKSWKFPFWVHEKTCFNNIDVHYRTELQPKASIQHVAEQWKITNVRPFSDAEINSVADTRVVKTQYGLSVEFSFKQGGVKYIPLMGKDKLPVDAKLNLQKAKIVTLSREGETDIYRIDI